MDKCLSGFEQPMPDQGRVVNTTDSLSCGPMCSEFSFYITAGQETCFYAQDMMAY